jgi:hypothetical protein
MKDLLQKLNLESSFTWEVKTDGTKYTILCEQMDVHDPESGSYITDMDETTCNAWLQKLADMIHEI